MTEKPHRLILMCKLSLLMLSPIGGPWTVLFNSHTIFEFHRAAMKALPCHVFPLDSWVLYQELMREKRCLRPCGWTERSKGKGRLKQWVSWKQRGGWRLHLCCFLTKSFTHFPSDLLIPCQCWTEGESLALGREEKSRSQSESNHAKKATDRLK